MDLTSEVVIQELFKKHRLRPSKRFGQNFLIDKGVLRKIIETANLRPEDIVLEIGPGLGTLTIELAKKAGKIIAIEKDSKMVEILKETLKDFKNVEIIQEDILKIPDSRFQILNSDKVVANLPYYIVSPVIRKFLESEFPLKEMILMVQKEVAQRICTKPPNMNLLAVSVQFYAEPKIISYVSKTSFWPQPKVDGTILKISNIKNKKLKIDKNLFFKIVKAGFSQPRKQILNNLSKMLKLDKEKVKSWLLKNNIQPSQRAETLGVKDWIKLSKSFKINQ
jgi:16S rRNA (adenine1518-N6/adenine1519-N6)-dimethyltransferase